MDNISTLKHPPVGVLADIIVAFIEFKRSLGFIYNIEEGVLYRFSIFTLEYEINGFEVPLQLIEEWLEFRKSEKPSTQRARTYCVLRMLRFAQKYGYIVHFPVLIERKPIPRYVPYILTEKELGRFFLCL